MRIYLVDVRGSGRFVEIGCSREGSRNLGNIMACGNNICENQNGICEFRSFVRTWLSTWPRWSTFVPFAPRIRRRRPSLVPRTGGGRLRSASLTWLLCGGVGYVEMKDFLCSSRRFAHECFFFAGRVQQYGWGARWGTLLLKVPTSVHAPSLVLVVPTGLL